MSDDSVHVPKISLTERLFAVFLRLVAISCFWFGLNYWALLIGYSFTAPGASISSSFPGGSRR